MVELWICLIIAIVVGILCFFGGSSYRERKNSQRIGSAEEIARKIVDDANKEAESSKREALVEAKDEIHRMRDKQESAYHQQQDELRDLQRQLLKREETIEKKADQTEKKAAELDRGLSRVKAKEKQVDQRLQEQTSKLEEIAGLSQAEARTQVLEEAKANSVHDLAQNLRSFENEFKDKSEHIARELVTTVIQRYSSDYVAESTVSVVALPNDEMKGRIIGREGRNIRAFENLTGVDLIIDDTPEAVVLSCFDPVRREKARLALEKLIVDGRIHPTRIEELYAKASKEVDHSIKEAGEAALDEVGIRSLDPELVTVLGKLKYRTSYGQNALQHSIEVAQLAGMMAAELGADVKLAKRGGLLHDIGKAVDHEIDEPHVALGIKLAKKYHESSAVIHCIAAHHNDEEPKTVEAILVQAADAISAARPGARRESMENYVKRLEDLENIANSFDGVDNSYAIQAGREIRIVVKPDKISEDQMTLLAHDIASKVEDELEYPGQIKINVIRETRIQDYAK